MLHLAHVRDLLPRNRSCECLQSSRIRLVRAACFVIYSSYSSVIMFSSEIFVILLLWLRHLLVTIPSAIVFNNRDYTVTVQPLYLVDD